MVICTCLRFQKYVNTWDNGISYQSSCSVTLSSGEPPANGPNIAQQAFPLSPQCRFGEATLTCPTAGRASPPMRQSEITTSGGRIHRGRSGLPGMHCPLPLWWLQHTPWHSASFTASFSLKCHLHNSLLANRCCWSPHPEEGNGRSCPLGSPPTKWFKVPSPPTPPVMAFDSHFSFQERNLIPPHLFQM